MRVWVAFNLLLLTSEGGLLLGRNSELERGSGLGAGSWKGFFGGGMDGDDRREMYWEEGGLRVEL